MVSWLLEAADHSDLRLEAADIISALQGWFAAVLLDTTEAKIIAIFDWRQMGPPDPEPELEPDPDPELEPDPDPGFTYTQLPICEFTSSDLSGLQV